MHQIEHYTQWMAFKPDSTDYQRALQQRLEGAGLTWQEAEREAERLVHQAIQDWK